ncbi:MAG: hypothetical protein QOF48_3826 [Verrucomicrobiota bacterium]|jgi:uncharacterized protein involved in exopolysaccharide biosynthesis
MRPFAQLRKYFEQWRALTEQEGRGIRAADWTRVAACQEEKSRLQTAIGMARQELAQTLPPAGPARTAMHRELDALLESLAIHERENAQTLGAQLEIADQQRTELHQASRQLRQVNQAYAPGRQPLWQSYS